MKDESIGGITLLSQSNTADLNPLGVDVSIVVNPQDVPGSEILAINPSCDSAVVDSPLIGVLFCSFES
jgi:hypothetical protein